MTKNNIKEKETQKVGSSIDIKSLIIGLLGAAVIGLSIYAFGTSKDTTTTTNKDAATSLEDSVADSYELVEMTDADLDAAKILIGDVIEAIRENNGFVNVYTSDDEEDFDSYYYNKNGEIFAIGNKDNYCNVYRKDQKAVIFTDYVYEDYAIDTISLIDNALNAVGKTSGVEMMKYTSDLYDLGDTIGMYELTVSSWDGIRALYEPISSEFADNMVDTMKDAMGEDWNPNFRFTINVTNEGLFAAYCSIYADSKWYTQWMIDGYALLYDWELQEEWYSLDLSDGETAEELLGELMEDIGEMVEKFMDDNPDMLVSDLEDETVVDNGDGTHTHPDGTVHDNSEHEETAEQGSKKEESTEKTDSENTVTYEGTIELDESNTITPEQAEEILSSATEDKE